MRTKRLTTAQATIAYLTSQYVERDGKEYAFFGGCFGIFGHGNVGGIGQALSQYPRFKYYQARNEQAMVHTAIAYAKVKNRMGALVCTTSIGPGATNMITGAATATINRLPVLLLTGDIFSNRSVDPVLQQLEYPYSNDISVNDCFKPVSKYWDRINRPEQLIAALPKAMRILTSAAETGAVTLALPQDVQAEAYDFPEHFFRKKVWRIARPRPDESLLEEAAGWIRASKSPVIIAGGGVIYSDSCRALSRWAGRTGIAVAETYAGKGALNFDDPQNLGAVGVTGTPGAIEACRKADLVIGIGTRYSDFTTQSQSAFQHPSVKFININICEFDAFKQGALPLTADARQTILALDRLTRDYQVSKTYRSLLASTRRQWEAQVDRVYAYRHAHGMSQGEVMGAVNHSSGPRDIVVCAAGSLPGDLHKYWRTRDPKGFHLEYGYSTMGYEIAGGLGCKLADPTREIYVMVGDGSYLMMAQELVTAVQEGLKLTVVLLNNNGFASIGGLSRSLGSGGFGTRYRYRNPRSGQLDGRTLPVDLAANAESLGARVVRAETTAALQAALAEARGQDRTTVIYVETDLEHRLPGYGWWEVPIAQVSTSREVKTNLQKLDRKRKSKKLYY